MSEEVKVGWGYQRVIENSEICEDLVVSEATHSPLSEPRSELGSGTGQQVWEPMFGLYGECGRESLVVFEGPQTPVCPRVASCPRVSGKREEQHTPVVFPPQSFLETGLLSITHMLRHQALFLALLSFSPIPPLYRGF